MEAVFSVDVERDLHTNKFEGIKSLSFLSKTLKKYKIPATFFVTGEIMEQFPGVMNLLKKQGHEIAIHGYSHRRYDSMSRKEQEDDLRKAIGAYKSLFGSIPTGFRAPQHSITSQLANMLGEMGIKYDSSKTPGNFMLLRHLFKNTNRKGILNNLFSRIKPYELNGLVEIPRASFIISTGGFELKIYPKLSYKALISIYNFFNIPLVFVMHSWDMVNIPSFTNRICSKEQFCRNLDLFLSYATKKFKFITMEKLYEKVKNS